MGDVVSGVTDAIGLTDTEDAGDKARKAAETQAAYQREALEYMKEREKLPQKFREGSLTQLAGIAGLEGGEGSQQALIDRAMESPLYGAMMGGQQAGEEAILRQAAATGGLRSGNVQENLAEFSSNLQNQALLESYNQQLSGLQGLASLPSQATTIAGMQSGIGETLAQGQVARAQANFAAQNQLFEDWTSLAGMMGGGGGFSDIRLKTNIKASGKKHGHNWYTWTWNKAAEALGLTGEGEGVMAHEVHATTP